MALWAESDNRGTQVIMPSAEVRRVLCVVYAAMLVQVACGGSAPPRPGELRGTVLPEPMPKPAFTLTTTAGAPFDFRAETHGTLTLLFFGYTHCPDICPVHMANIAAVLQKLPPPQARRVLGVVQVLMRLSLKLRGRPHLHPLPVQFLHLFVLLILEG